MEETDIAQGLKNEPDSTPQPSMQQNFRVVNAEGGHVTLSQSHFDDLNAALQRMQLVADESNATIKQYQKDMETMRRVSHPVECLKFLFEHLY